MQLRNILQFASAFELREAVIHPQRMCLSGLNSYYPIMAGLAVLRREPYWHRKRVCVIKGETIRGK
jgi:hypothetical protein